MFRHRFAPKFYIDCGDRIEVREWLSEMGFMWFGGASIIKNVYNLKEIYVKLEEKKCFSMVDSEEEYALVKPKLTVTSFEVERSQSNEDYGRNKELEELKRLHDEIGERLDALLGRQQAINL